VIVPLLASQNTIIRIGAIRVLGMLGGKEAYQEVNQMLSDPFSDVCEAAEEALATMK
jgi:HEAT repeat protein